MPLNYNAYFRLARLDKPAGAWLLLLPCWMGLALGGSYDVLLYALFALGSFTMRAAGCVINDMVDREFDAKVERTKTRPLASGEIKMRNAFIFLGILLLIGFGVLVQLPAISIFIGLASVPLFVLYPFMKRITYWPQFFLGLTFNIGILVAYGAAANEVSWVAAILYIGAVFWTLGYDTIYAHQDREDDIKAGVKSTALRLAEKSRFYIAMFYAVFVASIGSAIYYKFGGSMPGFSILAIAALHFAWQVKKLDINNTRLCHLLFRSNIYAGLLVVTALLVSGV